MHAMLVLVHVAHVSVFGVTVIPVIVFPLCVGLLLVVRMNRVSMTIAVLGR
jgi:hypothetical protein